MNDDKTGDMLRVDASDLIDELSRRLTALTRENAILSVQLRQALAAVEAGE
jgi:hypothetical protein